MARTETLTNLILRVRQRTDLENDTHVTDAEITTYINDAIAHVYDLLVAAAPSDYYSTSVTFTCTANVSSYSLATALGGSTFYKIRNVRLVANGLDYPMYPIQEEQSYYLRAPQGGEVIRVIYIPAATKLSAGSDTFDGVNGWEELVVCRAAIDIKIKREEDASLLINKARDMEKRIDSMAARDAGNPEHVVRRNRIRSREKRNSVDQWAFYDNGGMLIGYRLRGDNIEIYGRTAI